jgi:ribose transport system substrate-binding protein
VTRFLGNPYDQLLTQGVYSRGKELGLSLDFRAGATESDQAGQHAVFEAMLDRGCDAILVSPQTDVNLTPLVAKARKAGVSLINVDGALLPGAGYYVGPNQYDNGLSAAGYFIGRIPAGKVAVIKGVEADHGTSQRSQGFTDALASTPLRIAAQPFCSWDLQFALDTAAQLLKDDPELKGFFCMNDVMALGAAQAVKSAGRSRDIIVIGRDGIGAALDSIRAGELTGTVDVSPFEMGRIAVEVAVRILEGQRVPRFVTTPQRLVTRENIDRATK